MELDGDPERQLAVRFAVFHLLQAGRADGDRTIPARGLTRAPQRRPGWAVTQLERLAGPGCVTSES
ncbi:hypothetical protein [Micromonospora sp. KC606]|uniref:hypothetical protein n=1 Tax=Micromonospora sp. KC606 TaxID=2530379 RepID=UPI00269B2C93